MIPVLTDKRLSASQELQALFDEQIEKIFIFLDEQIQKLQMNHPRETVVCFQLRKSSVC
jgi:hypothetical protein